MWEDIIISVLTSIGEAIFSNRLSYLKKKMFDSKLNSIINEKLENYSDTSLDCSDFYKLVNNYVFTEMLRNYFFAINENLTKNDFLNKFVCFICQYCPTLNKIEVKNFIKIIEQVYLNFLQKTIEENYELNILFQLVKFSHRELLDRILKSEDELKRYINCLLNPQIEISDENIIEYHNNCKKDFSIIRFTGISGAENKQTQNINDFYIEPGFSYCSSIISNFYRHEAQVDKNNSLKLNELFDYSNKIVLLGSAGLGKSTSLNYLFCNYEEIFKQNSLKIKIDLKEYAKSIAEDKYTVLWCLSKEFSKRIPKRRLTFTEIENILDEYLSSGKCLVILDALDEIPSQFTRNKVRDEIANFCQVYYLNKFIISSRESGYLRNQFDNSFVHIKINEFDDEQIKDYTRNWIKVNNANTNFDVFTKNFFAEVKRAKCRNIIRNPIILVLALIIFDIGNNLPNRRVDFYKKCIDTFLEVREDRKDMLPNDRDFKNILGDNMVIPKIAHYKFAMQSNDIEYIFSEEELKKSILQAIEVPDTRIWIHPANLFAKYLVDRTELIREVDEGKYDFTHKTFYEYFLAVYFAKEIDVNDIITLLEKWIGDSNYNELAILIIEVIIEDNEVKRHKAIIEYLFDTIDRYYDAESLIYREKAIEYFIIIANLFNNNMLQPKFYERYHKLILLKSRLIHDANRYAVINDSTISISYNSDLIADFFHAYLTQDSHNIIELMGCFYYLSKETIGKICKDTYYHELLNHIKDLSIIIHNKPITNKKESYLETIIQKANDSFGYIANNHITLITESPLLYLNILNLFITQNNYDNISILTDYSFSNNYYFSYFIPHPIFFEMAYKLFDSANIYLVFLITTTICTNYNPEQFLYFILKNLTKHKYAPSDYTIEKRKTIINNTIEFWNILNGNFAECTDILNNKGLGCLVYNELNKKIISCYKEKNHNNYYSIKIRNYINSLNNEKTY